MRRITKAFHTRASSEHPLRRSVNSTRLRRWRFSAAAKSRRSQIGGSSPTCAMCSQAMEGVSSCVPPTPPRHNGANNRDRDRDRGRDRDNDCSDRGRDRRDRGGRESHERVHWDKDKGTPCLSSIITHLTCNCGGADINSTYRQCIVSMLNSSTYFTALTLCIYLVWNSNGCIPCSVQQTRHLYYRGWLGRVDMVLCIRLNFLE